MRTPQPPVPLPHDRAQPRGPLLRLDICGAPPEVRVGVGPVREERKVTTMHTFHWETTPGSDFDLVVFANAFEREVEMDLVEYGFTTYWTADSADLAEFVDAARHELALAREPDWSQVYGVDGLTFDPWPVSTCPDCLNETAHCGCPF
jgi:hypothetical protein